VTRKFKFVGDEPVDVPALRLVGVEPGQVVEADGDVADGLAGQAIWESVKQPVKKSTNDSQEG
jgi:hypothetical protein